MAEATRDHLQGLKVAITGASGNLGTALLRRLTEPDAGVAEIRGLARRRPPDVAPYSGVTWHLTDLGEPDSEATLAEFMDGADAVVHLAWALQPGRQPDTSSTCPRSARTRPGRSGTGSPRTGRPPASPARSTAGTSPRPSGSSARSPHGTRT